MCRERGTIYIDILLFYRHTLGRKKGKKDGLFIGRLFAGLGVFCGLFGVGCGQAACGASAVFAFPPRFTLFGVGSR